jgi:hypothetical protein
LDLWSEGVVKKVAALPTAASCEGVICVSPVRFANHGKVVVFQTNAPTPGFNDAGGFMQVFRFEIDQGEPAGLSCVSCPPAGVQPSGDSSLSSDDLVGESHPLDSRGVSEDGSRVFFDTPDALVPQDVNGQRDVYEWENGIRYLLSSGTGRWSSYFLDSSASGDNVYFSTIDNLVAADNDGGYDVYDARVGGGFPLPTPPVPCAGDCQGAPTPPPAPLSAATEAAVANGNVTPAPEVQSSKTAKPKTRSRVRKKKKPRKRTRGKHASVGRAVHGHGQGA